MENYIFTCDAQNVKKELLIAAALRLLKYGGLVAPVPLAIRVLSRCLQPINASSIGRLTIETNPGQDRSYAPSHRS